MSITEESRFQLYQRLIEALDEAEAATSMDRLPPTGWAGVATKRDPDQQRELSSQDLKLATRGLRSETRATGADIRAETSAMGSGLELRIEGVKTDLLTQQRTFMLTLMVTNEASAALVVAAVRLI